MRVGGPVSYLIYPVNEEDLLKTIRILKDEGIGYRFVGNATNIIVDDRGLAEAVIRITRMRSSQQKKVKDGAFVEVSGGVSLKSFIRNNAEKGLSGLEKLYWIPGTVGGAVKMNAGSFGASISDALEKLRIVNENGEMESYSKNNMAFSYRASSVRPFDCIVSAAFYMKNRDKSEIAADMDYVYTERKKRHPMEYPSSGSIFKSVDGESAWQFVEKAGLRGFRIGDACVSEKHTNFIVNAGHATAKDIKLLIDTIKKEVFEKIGVLLEEEVELWGFEE
jgi:UDP-N-acetylmuramate dehydrogenase